MLSVALPNELSTNRFLDLLPTIQRHARRAFRKHHAEQRHDFIQEAIAAAFVSFHRLLERGREQLAFPAALARFAIRRVYSGRRIGTDTNRNDVLSPAAWRQRGLTVQQSDPLDEVNGWNETFVEDTQTPVPDQVCFRIDFPDWLSSLSDRDRQIAEALGGGAMTRDAAREFGLSPARVSQLRQELRDSWSTFQS